MGVSSSLFYYRPLSLFLRISIVIELNLYSPTWPYKRIYVNKNNNFSFAAYIFKSVLLQELLSPYYEEDNRLVKFGEIGT